MIPLNAEQEETILFSLRELYKLHGYSQYKMNKFEEYDLYARNKDFLISDGIITFTDGSGKLLALKPDVTLSIVKNSKDNSILQRVYYTENVYRLAKGTHHFKEIMQVGLECIGPMDPFTVSEVLSLGCESLSFISPKTVLCISHLGILSEALSSVGISNEEKPVAFRLIGERNIHELSAFLSAHGVSDDGIRLFSDLFSVHGGAETLDFLTSILQNRVSTKTFTCFSETIRALSEYKNLRIDFSIVDDIHYYNGFVFKGYSECISSAILSGGQYDKLMRKMGRSDGAIGFAIYFDAIEQQTHERSQYDVDILLLYNENCPLSALQNVVSEFTKKRTSVAAHKNAPKDLHYRTLYVMEDGKAIKYD